jgi:hypothetical protein
MSAVPSATQMSVAVANIPGERTLQGHGGERRARRVSPSRGRIALSVAASVVLLALGLLWFISFRPQALGGPIAYVEVIDSTMAPTIPKGDVVAAQVQSSYRIGDLIVFRTPTARPGVTKMAVGRIVYENGVAGYLIKDDNLPAPSTYRPRNPDVIGRVRFHFARSRLVPFCLGFAAFFVAFVVAAWPVRRWRCHSSSILS